MIDDFTRGEIIGEITRPYQFWTNPTEFQPARCLAKGWFENDEQAIAFIKEKFPEMFPTPGCEMRRYDLDSTRRNEP